MSGGTEGRVGREGEHSLVQGLLRGLGLRGDNPTQTQRRRWGGGLGSLKVAKFPSGRIGVERRGIENHRGPFPVASGWRGDPEPSLLMGGL